MSSFFSEANLQIIKRILKYVTNGKKLCTYINKSLKTPLIVNELTNKTGLNYKFNK